jgi:hypothetical protein
MRTALKVGCSSSILSGIAAFPNSFNSLHECAVEQSRQLTMRQRGIPIGHYPPKTASFWAIISRRSDQFSEPKLLPEYGMARVSPHVDALDFVWVGDWQAGKSITDAKRQPNAQRTKPRRQRCKW